MEIIFDVYKRKIKNPNPYLERDLMIDRQKRIIIMIGKEECDNIDKK